MAYIKTFQDEHLNEYTYHRIHNIHLPDFEKDIGWSQPTVTVKSFKDKNASDVGAQPNRIKIYHFPFLVIPTIQFNTQEQLLAWAYSSVKPYLSDLSDSEDDLLPEPEPVVVPPPTPDSNPPITPSPDPIITDPISPSTDSTQT